MHRFGSLRAGTLALLAAAAGGCQSIGLPTAREMAAIEAQEKAIVLIKVTGTLDGSPSTVWGTPSGATTGL